MKNMLIGLLFVLVVPGCLSCGGGNGGEPAPVIRPQEGKELCGQACQHLNELTCIEGTPVPAPPDIVVCGGDAGCPELVACDADGGAATCVTCEWFCQYQHDNGVTWNTSCLLGIKACGEVESVCNK